MKCINCGAEWSTEENESDRIIQCPSCNFFVIPKKTPIKAALRWIVEAKGIDVLLNANLINSMLADLVKDEEKERNKIRLALSSGAGTMIYKLYERSNGELSEVDNNEFIKCLEENGFSEDYCESMLDFFSYAIQTRNNKYEKTEISSDNIGEKASNEYPAAKINRNKTQKSINECLRVVDLKKNYLVSMEIYLSGIIPDEVCEFVYTVRTEEKWETRDNVEYAPDVRRISIGEYKKLGYIPYEDIIQGESEFYISLFTVYRVGKKKVLSKVRKCQISRPVAGNVFWRISKGVFSGLTLWTKIESNYPINTVPAMVLCVCSGHETIINYNDSNAIRVKEIDSENLSFFSAKIYRQYHIDRKEITPEDNRKINKMHKCNFFLFLKNPDDEGSYAIRRED